MILPLRLIKASVVLLLVILISGCASIIGRQALDPPMLDLDVIPEQSWTDLNYHHDLICPELSNARTGCMAFMSAAAYDNQSRAQWASVVKEWEEAGLPIATEAMEVKMRTWPQAEKTAQDRTRRIAMEYRVELETVRGLDEVNLLLDGDVPAKKGTYILMHGFRTNKKSLFFIAESIRFSGFDVVLVDLYGHGDSQGEFSFSGKPDAELISNLIDNLDNPGPVHLAGMSMGGTTGVHVARKNDQVQSLLLLAPMLAFEDAFVDAGRAYSRAAHWVTQGALKRGANYALNEAGTPKEDTAVVQHVAELDIPVLIMGSKNDAVSPFAKLRQLEAGKVEFHAVQPRSHHAMILWSTDDYGTWRFWLERIQKGS
ncbi:hypothetical protein CWE09_09860 [Aliidiomarina minuta]|uniref:Serine aminopeptidase S33 domain-containing protein n=2 Tax=Aliidiomarina minuta TaxID=880057 RepID=A0A432WAB5_9GAMM|nr:hypothetical protein CWE09_09860 [Aliidiomarina minuta]